jgi:hypothetical protein
MNKKWIQSKYRKVATIRASQKTRIGENQKEYKRLLKDDNYTNVRFNPKNGALSAIHREHNFDPTIGKFGIPRGEYEKISLEVLYQYGKRIILDSEKTLYGLKSSDGLLEGISFDIKGIEGMSERNIIRKMYEASEKSAKILVLYYHDKTLFNKQKIIESYKSYLRNSKRKNVQTVYCIVDGKLYEI